MNIACVLRKSPDFGPEHVIWLKRQCERFIPHELFVCFTDTEIEGCAYAPLNTSWPKWWAKMEIYGSDLVGPTLILDLDTVIRGRFSPTEEQLKSSWVMRHFSRDGFRAPEEFACGIMLTTEEFRDKVYRHFSEKPAWYMGEARMDDQFYFQKYFDKELLRFQDEFPDVFVSYKLHVLQHGLNEDNVFINFHGKPRPWDISETWIPKIGANGHGQET